MMVKSVISAFGWKFFERISVQGTSFIVTLVLARLLTPEEYGLVSLLLVFTSIATVFVQGGFNTALIQGKGIDDDDYVSVLIFSIIVAVFLYGILFLTSDFLASFFSYSNFASSLRVIGLALFPGAINSVQVAKATRHLEFKVLYKGSLYPMLFAACVGIVMAFMGFGTWALVTQQLVSQILICIVLYYQTKWFPKGKFSGNSIKTLIPFGFKILASNILVAIFMNIRSMVIGRLYSPDSLGFFNRGKQFPQAVMESINGTIQSVLLPVYSLEQDNSVYLLQMVRKSVQLSTYIIFPMMFGLAAAAESLVLLLLTEKWLPCVPFLQMFAFSYMCQPTQLSTAQAYKAVGDGKTPLLLEIIRKTAEICLLLLALSHGTHAIALTSVFAGVISMAVALIPNIRVLGYTLKEQLMDLVFPFCLSAIMALGVFGIGQLAINTSVKLLLQLFVGISIYVLLSVILKPKPYLVLVDIIKKIVYE